MCYDYNRLMTDIEHLENNYNFIEHFTIGESVMKRGIHCLKIGSGRRKILISAAFHGLESITAALVMKFVEDYAARISDGNHFFGKSAAHIFVKNTLYILPMVNPDGIDIAANGIDLSNPVHQQLVKSVGISDFKHTWQANAHGVDLNHNYDALWSAVLPSPTPSKYGGERPECEPETKAVTTFVRRLRPDILLALHSQGGEIYYDFDGYCPAEALDLAEKMSAVSGYEVCRPTGTAAFGGCKDWFIREFDLPGFTIEVGHGQNPLPMSMLDEIYEENAKIILCTAKG